MKSSRIGSSWIWLAIGLAAVVFSAEVAWAADPLRIETALVWGTNDTESPNPKHKAIDADLAKKLSKSPYRWKHYFLVNHETVVIPEGQVKKNIKMSDHCVIDIKNLGEGRIEVMLHGDGRAISKNAEQLKDNWPLILAGNAKDDTAWMVVIKKAAQETARKP
jgi:hypothetical protein